MKSIIFFLLAISVAFTGFAQDRAFTDVVLQDVHNRESISFTVTRNVNVRHYRIEAGNDSVNFTVIATIPSKANSMAAVKYNYDLQAYDYTYYRVGKVEMNGGLPYSQIVAREKKQPLLQCEPQILPEVTEKSIAGR